MVAIHYRENEAAPTPAWTDFWLTEARSPELLLELTSRFPGDSARLSPARPLLALAIEGDLSGLREAVDSEERAEQEKDRIYWEPLKRELEAFRRAERSPGASS